MELIRGAVNIRLLRANLADVLSQVRFRHDRMLVVKYRQPLAAIVPVEDLKLLRAFESIEGIDGTEDKGVLAAALSYESDWGLNPREMREYEQMSLLGGRLPDNYGLNRRHLPMAQPSMAQPSMAQPSNDELA